jgi:hypothetical protein
MTGLPRVIAVDLRRHRRHLIAASVGVVVGVAALVFLLGLALGLRQVLLGEVLPVDRVEVSPASADFDVLALRFQLGADTLDNDQIERLEALPGVAAVYPKMKLIVPAMASGGERLLGSGMQTELVADGIDPALVADEVGEAFRYERDTAAVPCRSDRDCPDSAWCADRGLGGTGMCRSHVPVLVSNHLLELYNGSFRRAYNLPRLNPDFAVGFTFDMAFGASTLKPTARGGVIRERMRLAGFSDRAIPLGVTLPLDFVRELNASFGSAKDAEAYHSAIVQVESKAAVAGVIEAIQGMGLEVTDRGAERAATLMAVLMAVVAVIGGAMIAVAAVSVAHAFFMIVYHRRREIGVMRAVGARRSDIRAVILGEAAVVGLTAGFVGVLLATIATLGCDAVARSGLPDFPYKPDSFFALEPWLLAGAVVLAVAACLAGALIPAWRAAARDPAEILAGG